MALGRCGCLHEVDHCVNAHAVRGIEYELPPLQRVATHLQQALECGRLERADELGDPALESSRRHHGRVVVPNFVRDLEQVADDRLIVCRLPIVLLDGVRDVLGLHRRLFLIAPLIRGDRCAREAHPQLRCSAILGRRRSAACIGRLLVFVQQLEPIVRERKKLHVRPERRQPLRLHAERRLVALRFYAHRSECGTELFAREPAHELECTDVMAVQLARQFAQQRMHAPCRDTFDDELTPCDADRQRGAFEQ